MKKIFALLTIITFLVAGTAFAGGKEKEPPPKSDIEIQVLQPAPDSEVILDEVLLIKSKHEQGDLIKWEYNVPHDESEADIEVIVDREKGTYKATKGPVSEEVKSRAGDLPPEMMERFRELYRQRECEQEQLNQKAPEKLNQIEDIGSPRAAHTGYHSSGAKVVDGEYAQYAAVITKDLVGVDLAQTTQWLHWYGMGWNQGYRSVWTWPAQPSWIGTWWYVGGTTDYPITNGSSYCTSRWYAWYYNYDWLRNNLRTTATHNIYIYGYWSGGFKIEGTSAHAGESYGLLRYNVIHWFWPECMTCPPPI